MKQFTLPPENAAKTHCIRGHAFTGENTISRPGNRRACRECQRQKFVPATTRRRGTITPHTGANGYVYEGDVLQHRKVVEAAGGRPLTRKECVHHVDGDPRNNQPSNLVACEDVAYHNLLHRRQSALVACGDPNGLRCNKCRRYDHLSNLVVTRVGKDKILRAYHPGRGGCANRRQAAA